MNLRAKQIWQQAHRLFTKQKACGNREITLRLCSAVQFFPFGNNLEYNEHQWNTYGVLWVQNNNTGFLFVIISTLKLFGMDSLLSDWLEASCIHSKQLQFCLKSNLAINFITSSRWVLDQGRIWCETRSYRL